MRNIKTITTGGAMLKGRAAELYLGRCPAEDPCTPEQAATFRASVDGLAVTGSVPMAIANPPRRLCAHLGEDSGHTETCPSCRGNVQVKLLGCDLHGLCTVAKTVQDAACCQTCPDHVAARRILITGGLGDFIALESHMPADLRASLVEIAYATRAEGVIRQLTRLGGFPALRTERTLYSDFGTWDDPRKPFCFMGVADTEAASGVNLDGVMDWSIAARFPQIAGGTLPFVGSAFLKLRLADTGRFSLPAQYVAVQAYSPNDNRDGRDFSHGDWCWLLRRLEELDLPAVVLGKGGGWVPEHPRIIDLTGQTTVPESVEVLKAASGYVGIDSWLAVLAAQVFPADRLAIRTRNPGMNGWPLLCYYSPHREFSFVHHGEFLLNSDTLLEIV